METTYVCGCCLELNPIKDLRTPYSRPGLGVPEVYSVMLANCFDIHLNLDTDDECGICEECVGRLRDASDFKLQVQRSQADLRERLERALEIEDEKPAVLLEMFDDDGTNIEAMLRENQLTCDIDPAVKAELLREEGDGSNYKINEVGSAAGPRPAAGGAAREGDSAPLGCGDPCGSGALSRAVSARARQQLAMTCSVRLERLHQGRICHSAADQESTLTTHMEEMHTDSAAVRAEEEECTCDTCGERFTDKMDLVGHVQKHMETSHYCQSLKSISSNFLLAEHSHTHKASKASSETLTPISNLNVQGLIKAEKKSYSCHACNKSYKRKYFLFHHMKLHTGQILHQCNVCNKHFIHKRILNAHIRIHTVEKPYKCNICDKQFKQKRALDSHLMIHTGEKPYECSKPVSSKGSLDMPAKIHTGQKSEEDQKPHSCEICNRSFIKKNHLTNHIKIHTVKKPHKCELCSKRFKFNKDLIRHIRIHTGYKPYKCEICNKQFTAKSSLNIHTRIHTGQKPYKCDTCNKEFSQKGHLNGHIKIHTGEKPYKCLTCNKRFTHSTSLNSHIKIHRRKQYKCEICFKLFTHKVSLNVHIRGHTGQKPYKCEICKKLFSQHCHLIKHVRTHTGQKPYQCEICNKRFIRKDVLDIHTRIHTGQKPYQCDICNKRFTERSNMTSHIRIHTGQKPYKCDICDQKFPRKDYLTYHIRIHTGQKKYQCEICKERFTHKLSLNNHMRIHTGQES